MENYGENVGNGAETAYAAKENVNSPNLAAVHAELEEVYRYVSDMEDGAYDILLKFTRDQRVPSNGDKMSDQVKPVNETYPELLYDKARAIRSSLSKLEGHLSHISKLIG